MKRKSPGLIAPIVVALWFGAFFILPARHACAAQRLPEVAASKYWHRLLHYKPRYFGGVKSEVDEPAFFLAPGGKTDPLAELGATIAAFSRTDLKIGRLIQAPQCAFPERFRYLKSLGLVSPGQTAEPEPDCADFREWKAGLSAASATLVFSSAYPNNPASMFGHTFLRFNRVVHSGGVERNDLLDYGVNFAAMVPSSDSTIKYAVLGILGGYDGYFAVTKYYLKVNEYSDSESRDLWEYDLRLNADQIDRMVNHLWELFTMAKFDYYFVDENCSYQLLSLLEVANPEWDLMSRFRIYVLPGDTVKAVASYPGAVTAVKYRPSLRKKMLQKVHALERKGKREFDDVLSGRVPVEQTRDVDTSEALVAYLNYVKFRDAPHLDEERTAMLRRALVQRAKIREIPRPLAALEGRSRPDLGHHSSSLGFGARTSRGHGAMLGFVFRPGLHDLLNDDLGYEPYSQIDFLVTRLSYAVSEKKLRVDDFRLLDLTSLHPFEAVDPKISWRFGTGVGRMKDLACDTCLAFNAEAGPGLATSVFGGRALFYSLALVNFEAGHALPKGSRLGPALVAAVLASPSDDYKAVVRARADLDLFKNFDRGTAMNVAAKFGLDQAYALNPAWDLRLLSEYIPRASRGVNGYYEVGLHANHYY